MDKAKVPENKCLGNRHGVIDEGSKNRWGGLKTCSPFPLTDLSEDPVLELRASYHSNPLHLIALIRCNGYKLTQAQQNQKKYSLLRIVLHDADGFCCKADERKWAIIIINNNNNNNFLALTCCLPILPDLKKEAYFIVCSRAILSNSHLLFL